MKKIVLISSSLLLASVTMMAGVNKYERAANVPVARAEKSQVAAAKEFAVLKTSVNAESVRKGEVVKKVGGVDYVKTDKGYVRTLSSRLLSLTPAKSNLKVDFAATPTMQETFEGWDGETANWLPDGWTQEHKSTEFDAAAHPSWTWETTAGGWYTYAIQGDYIAGIACAVDIDMETFQFLNFQQDEWLVTPEVTVAAGDFLSFILQYSPGWTLLDNDKALVGTYEFTKENTNLEVLVSTDNGANWTKIWDAISDDAKVNYSEADLDATLVSFGWIGVAEDLSAYAGKKVKIAFRYVGKAGQDMALDMVQVSSDVTADASYLPPMNYLVCASNAERSYVPYARIGEPYQDALWESTSIFASEFEWAYANLEDPDADLIATTRNLTTNYPWASLPYPTLTTKVGNSTASYTFGAWQNGAETYPSWFMNGGTMEMVYSDGTTSAYPVTNWEYDLADGIKWYSDMTVAETDGAAASWEETFAADGVENPKFEGFGVYLPAPVKSYALNNINVEVIGASVKGNLDSPIEVTVYKIESNGTIGSAIGKGSFTINDGTLDAKRGIYTIPCGFYEKVGAVEQQVILTIDSDVLVVIDGKYKDVEFALPTYTSLNGEAQLSYTNIYILGKDGDTGDWLIQGANYFGSKLESGDWSLFTSFGVTFDPIYPWLFINNPEMEENVNEFEANVAGDSRVFQLDSYFVPDAFEVSGEGLDEWYTVTVGEYDTTTGLIPVTVDVDPYTESGERVSAIDISVPGAKETIWVAQHSADSVEGVEAATTTVAVVDGDFVVTSANASAVAVYNVAGQKVAEAAVSGKTVVPGAGLANGMYILKFNDNTVVKVVK